MMQKNPERLAWLVVWGAFLVFLALCAAVPVGSRSYLLYSDSPRQASFEWIGGTPRIQGPTDPAPIAVTSATKLLQVLEGSTIEMDENSRGFVTFYDGSTLYIFPSTRVILSKMRVTTFDWGRAPNKLVIEQTRGRIRITLAPLYASAGATPHSREVLVRASHFDASLIEGSVAVDVTTESSQITSRDGIANVTAQGRTVSISRRQRTVATRGNPPLAAMPAEQDLVVNGDFKDPPDRGWNSYQDPASAGAAVGRAEVVALGDRLAGHIIRSNAGTTSADTGIIQSFAKEVSDFRVLKLNADIRLHYQSLSGGGMRSSEYPLILRLKYRDVNGSEAEWVHGFYYQNTTNNPTNNGELVPVDVWVPFESGNLFEILEFKPFYITSLQIYASGWDYESYVTNIRLIVE